MKINNKFMRAFAMFASLMMLTIVAVPMVAAERPTHTMNTMITQLPMTNEVVGRESILVHEMNPMKGWILPGIVIAKLKAAGVAVTTASIAAGTKLILAGVWISRESVAAAKLLINVGIRVTRDAVNAAKALSRAGIRVTRDAIDAAKSLIRTGIRVTRDAIDIVKRAMPIIRRELIKQGREAGSNAIENWLRGNCIIDGTRTPDGPTGDLFSARTAQRIGRQVYGPRLRLF